MLSKHIKLETFKNKISTKNIKKIYNNLIHNRSELIKSLSLNYQYSFKKKNLLKYKKSKNFTSHGNWIGISIAHRS